MESVRPNFGPYPSEKSALQAVVNRLVKALQPFRIYLFGSRAEGRAHPDSDFDLLVGGCQGSCRMKLHYAASRSSLSSSTVFSGLR